MELHRAFHDIQDLNFATGVHYNHQWTMQTKLLCILCKTSIFFVIVDLFLHGLSKRKCSGALTCGMRVHTQDGFDTDRRTARFYASVSNICATFLLFIARFQCIS